MQKPDFHVENRMRGFIAISLQRSLSAKPIIYFNARNDSHADTSLSKRQVLNSARSRIGGVLWCDGDFNLLLWVLDILKDIAILCMAVAAIALGRHWRASNLARHDAQSRAMAIAVDQARETKEAAARLEARVEALGREVATIASDRRERQARRGLEVQIHALLHATNDPFLAFDEIRDELAASAQDKDGLAADELRYVLMSMVKDRVIAQLDRDRYFIASDFETDDGADAKSDDET